MMDGHIWFVGWYDGGDYHEIKITQKEVDNCGTAGCGLNSILYYIGGKYGDEALLEALQKDELMSEIPAIKNGAVVLLDSTSRLAASTTPSILSIPATIDEYLDVLSEACGKINE